MTTFTAKIPVLFGQNIFSVSAILKLPSIGPNSYIWFSLAMFHLHKGIQHMHEILLLAMYHNFDIDHSLKFIMNDFLIVNISVANWIEYNEHNCIHLFCSNFQSLFLPFEWKYHHSLPNAICIVLHLLLKYYKKLQVRLLYILRIHNLFSEAWMVCVDLR